MEVRTDERFLSALPFTLNTLFSGGSGLGLWIAKKIITLHNVNYFNCLSIYALAEYTDPIRVISASHPRGRVRVLPSSSRFLFSTNPAA